MKTKFLKYIFVLVLVVLAIFAWRQPKQHETSSESPQKIDQSTTNVSVVIPKTNIATQTMAVSPVLKTNIVRNDREKVEAIRQYMESQNIPIEFYGQVIDQNSNPVSGVIVKGVVLHIKVIVPAPWGDEDQNIPINEKTDLEGRLEARDVSGRAFDIESIQKDGYRLSPKTQMDYAYSGVANPYHPDPQNPLIIRMWKLAEPQQLVSHHLSRIGIPVDGQPVQFDLFNGKKVPSGGQLIVRLKRDPQIIAPRSRYDWSLQLEIPNGGLATNNDEFMYQAPESGYQETFKFDMPKDADNWTTAINQQFYIQLENGKSFGSLVVRMNTIHDTPPLGINLDIIINPSGSRSLQP